MTDPAQHDPTQWELFERIFPLAEPERRRELEALRARDAAAADGVEKLLAAEAEGQFTGRDLAARRAEWGGLALSAAPGDDPVEIGEFRVLRRLGEGGMGVVFECEQRDPRRRVAVKVLRSFGLDTEAATRFRREADLLALLEHPGIARVYSTGEAETPTGACHWLAMELVEGQDPLAFAARFQLNVPARCELLAKICDAVHHAHQHGVVHRDLKPGNLLVAGDGPSTARPKVLDFGVARVVQGDGLPGRSTLMTQLTQTGQLVGTLAYMSPEQLDGDPDAVDHRSDIYALGVIAYELLAGRLPIDVSAVGFPAAVRMIQDRAPIRLGSRAPELRGDIEVVIARALEKEPWLRYGSAATLAEDLRNVANDRPILAQPASGWQQFRRFTRRHKGPVALALVLLVSALAALVVFANLASKNRDLAGRERGLRKQADQARRDLRRALYRSQMNLASSLLGSMGGIAQSRPYTDDWIPTAAEPEDIRGFEWYLLRALSHSERVVVAKEQHQPFVFGPAGKTVVGIGWTNVRYDAQTGEHLSGRPMAANLFPDATASFGVLARSTGIEAVRIGEGLITEHQLGYVPTATGISPDGTHAAVAGMVGEQCVLDFFSMPELTALGRVQLPTRSLFVIEFSPDGRQMVVPGQRGGIYVLGTKPLQLLRTVKAPRVEALHYSPDGRFLAAGASTPFVRVWDTSTWELVRQLPAPSPRVLAWRPDGEWLLVGGRDQSVRLLPVFREVGERLLGVQDVALFGADWDREGGRVLAYSNEVRVYSAERAPLRIFPASGDVLSLWFCKDSTELRVASGGRLRRWSVESHRELASEPGDQWLPNRDGRLELVVEGSRCMVRRAEDRVVVARHEFGFEVLRAAWSPIADQLLLGGYVGPSHTELWRWPVDDSPSKVVRTGQLSDLVWRADGRRAVYLTRPGRVSEVDVSTGEVRATEPVFRNPTQLAARADHGRIVGAEYNGDFRLIEADLAVGPPVDAHSGTLLDLAWSPDGSRLVTAGEDRLVRLWDTATWESMLSLPHPKAVVRVAWSADGTRLATACRDGLVRVWDSRGARD